MRQKFDQYLNEEFIDKEAVAHLDRAKKIISNLKIASNIKMKINDIFYELFNLLKKA